MSEIRFKATRRVSSSSGSYREIVKSGDLKFDWAGDSDDVINIPKEAISGQRIIIDCNKETGEFSIKF